jgi:N-ethylmaleimide reductase
MIGIAVFDYVQVSARIMVAAALLHEELKRFKEFWRQGAANEMTMSRTSTLFTPVSIGDISLKNRLVMAPMTRSRADDRHAPTALNVLYYSQRAGAGLILTEGTAPDPMGQGYLRVPGIYTADQVAGWRGVTSAVHNQGAAIFLQLMHVGRVSHPSFLDGAEPICPSAIAVSEGQIFTATGPQPFVTPRALESDEVDKVIATYGRAAHLAAEAGFDGVELHATSGYLPAQFLLPTINQRTDRWGGTVEGRARFLLEVVDSMAAVRGPARVGVRIGPAFTFNDAHDPDPHATWGHVLPELARRGLGYLHLVNVPVDWDVLGFVRTRWPGILIANGGYDLARAEADLAAGRADLVSFGKSFLANPDLPERLATGAPLNAPDAKYFYAGDAKGYTDYPVVAEEPSVAMSGGPTLR